MGQALVQRSPIAAELFARASETLGYDLLDICVNGPTERLNSTECCQPALFVHSIAALETLKTDRPEIFSDVQAVAGLSLGEYSALAAAGAINFEDGVRIVQARGAAMQASSDKVASGMASVLGLAAEKVACLCDVARQPGEILQVANLLCPGNIAISGHAGSLQAAEKAASDAGAMKYIRLSVAGAFHTSLMDSAVEALGTAIDQVAFQRPNVPVYSNVDAAAHLDPADFRALLTKQVVSPVLWEQSLRNLIAAGVDQFYEIGAGRVLSGTLKRIDRKIACECISD